MPGPEVTVNSRKYDLTIRRSWTARLLENHGSLLVLVGEFDRAVEHPDLGRIAAGTISYEYYWLDRWYNVFKFHEPGGSLRNWYCNVSMPPTFADGVLDYVDLDIDILIWPGKEPIILDEEEFIENANRFSYSRDLIKNAESALEELKNIIRNREFPFSRTTI
jgi:protein associated with RNAse G/E